MSEPQFLREAPYEEAMNVWWITQEEKQPLQHTIWTADFMAMAKHDIACPVCFERHAIIERNVTPGQGAQTVQPCRECQKVGHRIVRIPRWLRRWLPESVTGGRQ